MISELNDSEIISVFGGMKLQKADPNTICAANVSLDAYVNHYGVAVGTSLFAADQANVVLGNERQWAPSTPGCDNL